MPKSKRDKKVSLTQTKKKGLELKQKMIEDIRENIDKYARVFVFSTQNMRNSKLKDVRQEWKHSRFYFGKNKVMAMALGRSAEDEYRDGLHEVTRRLWGQMGLLLTNQTKQQVLKWFDDFAEADYARSGNTATQTVILEEGPIEAFPHSIEPQLRQLGLPTSLQKGVIHLIKDHQVCECGQTLTPEQARILKLFGHMMAEFRISIESVWQNDGSFELFTNRRPESLPISKVKIKAPGVYKGDVNEDTVAMATMDDESEEEESED